MEVCIADATYSLTAVCQSSTPAGQPQLAAEARGKISRAKPLARCSGISSSSSASTWVSGWALASPGIGSEPARVPAFSERT